MCADEFDHENFEETVRDIAREVGRSVERAMERFDIDEMADTVGVDPDRAREWADSAGSWLRSQFERLGDEAARQGFGGPQPSSQRNEPRTPEPTRTTGEDPLRSAEPHPLDLPTDQQGLAMAALESGRWQVEAGTGRLTAKGDGPGPRDALDVTRELQTRDWITADGELTLAGRWALERWLRGSTAAG
jgi:hypothetical protein